MQPSTTEARRCYGPFLGHTYANIFPRRLRAMVLDSLLNPPVVIRGAAARFGNGISNMDRVLGRFASLCESVGPGRCALVGEGRVAARVQALLALLRRAPIPAPPAQPPGALTYGDVLLPMFAGSQDPGAGHSSAKISTRPPTPTARRWQRGVERLSPVAERQPVTR